MEKNEDAKYIQKHFSHQLSDQLCHLSRRIAHQGYVPPEDNQNTLAPSLQQLSQKGR